MGTRLTKTTSRQENVSVVCRAIDGEKEIIGGNLIPANKKFSRVFASR
jgi:hypothetical protein